MTNTNRVDLLAVLAELSSRYPDWRFGQLVANVSDWAVVGIWDVEDSDLLAAARAHLQAAHASDLNGRPTLPHSA
jgi:hypothetical protein